MILKYSIYRYEFHEFIILQYSNNWKEYTITPILSMTKWRGAIHPIVCMPTCSIWSPNQNETLKVCCLICILRKTKGYEEHSCLYDRKIMRHILASWWLTSNKILPSILNFAFISNFKTSNVYMLHLIRIIYIYI